MNLALALSIGGFICTLIALLANYFRVTADILQRLMALETKIDVYWRVVENNALTLLKSYPSALEKDILLHKLTRRELSYDEAMRLQAFLTCELDDTIQNNKLAYVLVLGRLAQIIEELSPKKEKRSWWGSFFQCLTQKLNMR